MKDLSKSFEGFGMRLGDLGKALGEVAREVAETVADGAQGAAQQFQDFAEIMKPLLGDGRKLTRDEFLAALRDNANSGPEYETMRANMREFLAKHGDEAFARLVRHDFEVEWTPKGFKMTSGVRSEEDE